MLWENALNLLARSACVSIVRIVILITLIACPKVKGEGNARASVKLLPHIIMHKSVSLPVYVCVWGVCACIGKPNKRENSLVCKTQNKS